MKLFNFQFGRVSTSEGGREKQDQKEMPPHSPLISIAIFVSSFRIQLLLIIYVLFPSLVNCKSIFVANQVHPIYSFAELSAFNLHPLHSIHFNLALSLSSFSLILLFYPFLIRNELSSFPYDYSLAIKMNSSLCRGGRRRRGTTNGNN